MTEKTEKTKITISPQELLEQFQNAAGDDTLSSGERALAAKMCVLSAHMIRIETIAARSIKALGARVTTLESLLQKAAQQAAQQPSVVEMPTKSTPTAAAPTASTNEEDPEAAEKEAIAKFLAGEDPPVPGDAQEGAPVIPINNKESA